MKLQTKVPGGDANGLDAITPALTRNPTGTHVVIAIVNTAKLTTDTDTGDVEPTVRLLRVEVIPPEDKGAAEDLMRRALERRQGRSVLPIELEDEIKMMFGSLDMSTGELLDQGASDDTDEDPDGGA